MSEVSFLDNQLETYIHDMRSTKEFSTLKGIRQLAEKMVEMKKKKNVSYLFNLLVLPINRGHRTLSSHLLAPPYHSNALLDAKLNLHMQDGWDCPHLMDPWPS